MLPRRRFLTALAAAPVAASLMPRTASAAPPVWQRNAVAVGGIDPTGYLVEGKVVAGDPRYRLIWRDATWHFASAATRDMFEMDPKRYAPRFGGYCAYALAKGALVASDPAAFSVYEGRTYLNQSFAVRGIWAVDIPGHIAQALARWPAILDS